MWVLLWRRAIRAHHWAQTLYPTASWGTGTAITNRWISHGHQTTQGYSDVFYKETSGESADLYQHCLHVTGLLVVKCTGRWRRSNLCRWASLERYFLSSSCQKIAVRATQSLYFYAYTSKNIYIYCKRWKYIICIPLVLVELASAVSTCNNGKGCF